VIEEILKTIQDKYKIKNIDLMENSELNSQQISRYRKGKLNLTPNQLWNLISALDKVNPQARIDLGLKIGGCYSNEKEIDWDRFITSIPKKDVKRILYAIGKLIDSDELESK